MKQFLIELLWYAVFGFVISVGVLIKLFRFFFFFFFVLSFPKDSISLRHHWWLTIMMRLVLSTVWDLSKLVMPNKVQN